MEVGQHLAAVLGDEQEVLDAHSAEAVAVEAGLDRDHVARHELLADQAEARSLVDGEADPVTEPVVEAVPEHLPSSFVSCVG